MPTTPFFSLASANVSSSVTANSFNKFFNFPSGTPLASKLTMFPSQGSSMAKSFIAPGSQPSCAPRINLPCDLSKKPFNPGALLASLVFIVPLNNGTCGTFTPLDLSPLATNAN